MNKILIRIGMNVLISDLIICLVLFPIAIFSGTHTEKTDCYDKFNHKIEGVFCDMEVSNYPLLKTFSVGLMFSLLILGFILTSIGVFFFKPLKDNWGNRFKKKFTRSEGVR